MEYILIRICWCCIAQYLCLVPLQIIRWFASPIILAAIGTVLWAIFYISRMILSASIIGYPISVITGIPLCIGVILWFCITSPHILTIVILFPEYIGISLIYILSALGSLPGFLPGPFSIFPGYILYLPVQFIWQGLIYFLLCGFNLIFLMYAFIWIIPSFVVLTFFNPLFQCITIILMSYLLLNTFIKLITCILFPCLGPIYIIQYCFTAYICILSRTIIFYIICGICCISLIFSYQTIFCSVFILYLSALFIPSSIIICCIIITSICYFIFTTQSVFTIFPVLIPICILIILRDLNILVLSGGTCCCYAPCVIICVICLILLSTPYRLICDLIILCIILIISCSLPYLIFCIVQFINLILCLILSTAPCSIPLILCVISICSIYLTPIICCILCCISIIIIPQIIIVCYFIVLFICGCVCPYLNCCVLPVCLILYYSCIIPIYCCLSYLCCLLISYIILGIILGSILSICLCCLIIIFSSLSIVCIFLYSPFLICCICLFLIFVVCCILLLCLNTPLICLICGSPLSPFIICFQILTLCNLYYPFLCLTQCCMLCICSPFIELLCCLDCIVSNPIELLNILISYLLFSPRIRFISRGVC